MHMVPRGSAFSFNVSYEFPYVTGIISSIDVYLETVKIDVNPNPQKLSPGAEEIVDFTGLQTNNSKTFAAEIHPIYAILACDNSEIGNLYYQEDCNRLMIFNDRKFIGSGTLYNGMNANILFGNMTTLTLYESYVPELYAQVYFYSPKNVGFTFDQYRAGCQNEAVTLNSTEQYAEIRFTKLNPNSQKFIQDAKFNGKNNTRLYVYSGIREILNTNDMPSDNLVYVIYSNATFFVSSDHFLPEKVYTFVAVNGSVSYRIGDLYKRTTRASTKPAPTTITPKFGGTRSFNVIFFFITYLMKRLFEEH
ncbi:hypothetical protein WR25_26547 [Diploscapter pachys]|uniref:CUB-like domain-containing protein n=1 Tax=Diploscapter pachys TaxID=2018661 RepID=A0A2A2LIX6_9BILA|nr:hypothetical protein WR25_26547 [Diploscapter pachys]